MLKDIKFGLFDVFTYTLPGLYILFSLIIVLDSSSIGMTDIITDLKENLNLTIGLTVIIAGYIIGFANDSTGSILRKTLGKRFIKKPERKLMEVSISEKYSLVREYSKENFRYIETWNALKSMSSNLSSASLFLFICSGIKLILVYPNQIAEWIVIMILAILMSIVFLRKSIKFATWAIKELDNAAELIIFGKEKYGLSSDLPESVKDNLEVKTPAKNPIRIDKED